MADSPGLYKLKQVFSRTLTIDHTQVPSSQTDFPVPVRISNRTLRHASHGGHVNNLNGYDIQFYSDSGLTTKLKWEMERYNYGTGEVSAWVKIASLSSSSDTIFYMAYGDPSVVTDQSDAVNTWSNNYSDVYHLNDANILVDSTGNHNCSQGGTSIVLPGAGIVGGGGAFQNASGRYLATNTAFNPNALTYSMWVYALSVPNSNNAVVVKNNANISFTGIYVRSDRKLQTLVKATTQLQYNGTGATTLSLNTWYYLAVTYDSTGGLIGYVNASVDGTVAANGVANNGTPDVQIGNANPDNKYWDGAIDEVHLAAVVRSPDWITCEYNSQKPDATFVSIGNET